MADRSVDHVTEMTPASTGGPMGPQAASDGPSTGSANAKELYFDKLDSGYTVGTAGSKAA